MNDIIEEQEFEVGEMTEQSIENNFQTIGKFLRKERERHGLLLRDISKNTKISMTMLELLEQDEFSQLPNRAYVNGYIKSYARELSIDQNLALNILEETYSLLGNQKIQNKNESTNNGPVKLYSVPFKISISKAITTTGVIILIIMAYIYFSNKGHNSVLNTKQSTETITPKTVSETTPLQKDVVVTDIKSNKEVAKEVAKDISTAPIPATTAPKKVEATKEKRKLTPIYGALYTLRESSDEEKKLISSSTKSQYQDGKHNLVIVSKDEKTWMTYKKDSDEVKQFKLKKNAELLVSGDEIRLFFGNINATDIFLNDMKVVAPSKTGVKSLVIPSNASTKYKLPLFIYKEDGTVITSEEYEQNP